MAEKKVIGNLKLRIPAGRATAGPPVGSTLGQWGLNMMDFINPFNEATKDLMGKNVIVHIRVFLLFCLSKRGGSSILRSLSQAAPGIYSFWEARAMPY